MQVDEQTAKTLLGARGFPIPRGEATNTAEGARAIATRLSTPVVLKPLVLSGGRGKAGLIRFAETPADASREAEALLATGGVPSVRVEERVPIDRELYVAILNDPRSKGPLVLYSDDGGVDVESSVIRRLPVDIREGLGLEAARELAGEKLAPTLVALYRFYREVDAELVEINPLATTADGRLVALDAKLVLDESALARHPELPPAPESGTALERKARALGLYYIELDGDVGILANGAGLTMATLDVVRVHGGRPANFMEIGGDAYRKAEAALGVVLGNPRIRSLLVNLCGAYARCDVMVEGFLAAWRSLAPSIPVSFSIRGTGQEEARRLVRDRLGIEPFETMDEAVRAAVDAAARQR